MISETQKELIRYWENGLNLFSILFLVLCLVALYDLITKIKAHKKEKNKWPIKTLGIFIEFGQGDPN